MVETQLTEHGEKIKEIAKALSVGHIEAVMSMKDTLLKLDPSHFERIAAVLKATAAAGNGCCTGG